MADGKTIHVIGAVIVVLIIAIVAGLFLWHSQAPSLNAPGSGSGTGLQLGASVSPPSVIANVTSVITLTASATGGLQPYYFQWYNDTGGSSTPIVGQTGTTLYINAAGPGTYQYYVSVSDSETPAKTVSSSPVSVKIVVPPLTASISPQQSNSYVGQTITLTATAAHGVPPYKYQWYNDTTGTGVPVLGQTGQTLSINATVAGKYAYYVSVTDSETPAKTSYSNPTTVTVNSTFMVPVTITNSQPSATAAPFQQMIVFNPSTYSSHESQNLGNIRFYEGSEELYSWCESGCTSNSQSAIFWVKLPNGIGSESSVDINMVFLSTAANYDGNYAGEAPQLSQLYAQYDNGAQVFNSYWNFAGTSLPPGVTMVSTNPQFANLTVNNGLYGSAEWSNYYGTGRVRAVFSTPSSSYVMDTFLSAISNGGTEWYSNWFGGTSLTDSSPCGDCVSSEGYWSGIETASPPTPSYVVFVYEVPGSSTTLPYWYGSNGVLQPQSGNLGNVGGINITNPIQSLMFAAGQGTITGTIQWVRIRAYPPNGVMPTVSFST